MKGEPIGLVPPNVAGALGCLLLGWRLSMVLLWPLAVLWAGDALFPALGWWPVTWQLYLASVVVLLPLTARRARRK